MAKLEKNAPNGMSSESVIGSEMEIVGDIKCNGIMRVVGKLDGTINCSELIVEENAKITGAISAGSVSIDGPRACYDESKRVGETITYIFHAHFYSSQSKCSKIITTKQ